MSAYNGAAQSPIAIDSKTAVVDPKLALPTLINIHGGCNRSDIFTNEHTFEILEDFCDHLGVKFNGETFNLLQLHSHTFSEHSLDGQMYDGELHMVSN